MFARVATAAMVAAGAAAQDLQSDPSTARDMLFNNPGAELPDELLSESVRPRGELEVSYLSASKLEVNMHVDDIQLKAITTNTSMMIGSNTHNRFVIAAERKLVHGHTIAEVRLTDKTFLTVESRNGRNVMMEVDGSEHSEQQLANMYEESPAVHAGVKHAHAAYQAAMSELFTTHSKPLAAFVDMAWRVGTEHAVTGTEYPHTLPFSMLAMEASKEIDWSPPPGSPTHGGSSPRRALQSAPSACSEKGWFDCGSGLFGLPEQHSYGGVAYCCPAGTTGSGGLLDCDAGSYSDSGCTGMCGPHCNCWQQICNSCCYMTWCYEHDLCCTQVGYAGDACWRVLQDYMHGSIACYDAYPRCNVIFSGH